MIFIPRQHLLGTWRTAWDSVATFSKPSLNGAGRSADGRTTVTSGCNRSARVEQRLLMMCVRERRSRTFQVKHRKEVGYRLVSTS